MQPDFWNDKRAPGVPNDIDLSSYKSVIEVFERSCKRFADRPAFSNLGGLYPFEDSALVDRVDTITALEFYHL